MERLWTVQTRGDVQDAPVGGGDGDGKAAPPAVDEVGLKMLARLHAFFVAFLRRHGPGGASGAGADRGAAEGATDVGDENLDGGGSQFKASLRESCLEPYFSLFVEDGRTIRLLGGRRVMTLHYDEFMSELNDFEFRGGGGGGITNELLLKHSFGAYLYHFPLRALPALNVALALAVATLWRCRHDSVFAARDVPEPDRTNTHVDSQQSSGASKVDRFLDSCQLTVRFVHVGPQLPMADIKTGLVKKFISVKGHVVKARPKKLRVATADFACQKCASILSYAFEKGRFSVPTKCSNPTCRSKAFTLIRPTARYTNVQELRLQEAQDESTTHAGRTPRQLEVELTHDLIDACRPGDIILLACHVDAVNSALAAGRAGKRAQETSTYKLFLQGHSITTLSETNQRAGGGGTGTGSASSSGGAQNAYTQQQLQNITQLCHADHRCLGLTERRAFPFDLLVRSLCPSIIGHHAVKAGILLCLLGGTPPASQQMDRGSTIRSNSHILIVGDPGMGKSQMLLAATQLAARSVYVGGNTSSTTGLTVTLTKEEGGETGIEAGALVLADQGVACIDELDKCKHLDGLLEAMEQQCVSIAKAGVVASLPARCSIVAAANPKHGTYNMSKSVAENLNMARPILSRFDLVFILRDRVDKDQDRLVSTNIMSLYRKSSGENIRSKVTIPPSPSDILGVGIGDGDEAGGAPPVDNRVPLEKRLAWVSTFNEPLPAGLVRDYIAYAREYCKPKLTPEAAVVLKEYYMNLRYPSHGRHPRDSVPITTRQLEALIRLSQARAKACLREFVLREDALDVVELLKKSVEQVHTDEFGIVDKTRAGAAGQSNRKLRREFTKEIFRLVGAGAECSHDDLLRVADRVQLPLSDFNTMIDDMRSNGTVIKKPNGRYQILS